MGAQVTIALDAMGGDFGPECVVPAAAMSLKQRPYLRFAMYGDAAKINPVLDAYPELKNVSDVFHTDVFVENHEKPSSALRKGKNSSMRLAIEAVRARK